WLLSAVAILESSAVQTALRRENGTRQTCTVPDPREPGTRGEPHPGTVGPAPRPSRPTPPSGGPTPHLARMPSRGWRSGDLLKAPTRPRRRAYGRMACKASGKVG